MIKNFKGINTLQDPEFTRFGLQPLDYKHKDLAIPYELVINFSKGIAYVMNPDGTKLIPLNDPSLLDHLFDFNNPHRVTKDQIGLGNVLNVEQASYDDLEDHKKDYNNPHRVTKEQVGLGNVLNVEQASKEDMENFKEVYNEYMKELQDLIDKLNQLYRPQCEAPQDIRHNVIFNTIPEEAIVKVFYNNKWNKGKMHQLADGSYRYEITDEPDAGEGGNLNIELLPEDGIVKLYYNRKWNEGLKHRLPEFGEYNVELNKEKQLYQLTIRTNPPINSPKDGFVHIMKINDETYSIANYTFKSVLTEDDVIEIDAGFNFKNPTKLEYKEIKNYSINKDTELLIDFELTSEEPGEEEDNLPVDPNKQIPGMDTLNISDSNLFEMVKVPGEEKYIVSFAGNESRSKITAHGDKEAFKSEILIYELNNDNQFTCIRRFIGKYIREESPNKISKDCKHMIFVGEENEAFRAIDISISQTRYKNPHFKFSTKNEFNTDNKCSAVFVNNDIFVLFSTTHKLVKFTRTSNGYDNGTVIASDIPGKYLTTNKSDILVTYNSTTRGRSSLTVQAIYTYESNTLKKVDTSSIISINPSNDTSIFFNDSNKIFISNSESSSIYADISDGRISNHKTISHGGVYSSGIITSHNIAMAMGESNNLDLYDYMNSTRDHILDISDNESSTIGPKILEFIFNDRLFILVSDRMMIYRFNPSASNLPDKIVKTNLLSKPDRV